MTNVDPFKNGFMLSVEGALMYIYLTHCKSCSSARRIWREMLEESYVLGIEEK